MSIQAMTWALSIPIPPSPKLTLVAIGNYADENGHCFPSIKRLAADSSQSYDTVSRRLRELESLGLLVRLARHISPEGVLNQEGRGRRTSDEIRLRLSVTPDGVKAGLAAAENEPQEHTETEDSASPPTPQVAGGKLQGLSPHSPAGAAPALLRDQEPSLEPNKEDSPPTPQAGGDDSEIDQSSEATQPAEIDGWESFKAVFEADSAPILRVSLAKGLFAALKPEERKLATNAARGLIAQRKGEKKPGMKPAAQTFLREIEAWPGYAKLAPPEATPPTFIVEHSPEDLALRVLDRILNRASQQMKFDLAQGVNGWWRTVPVPSDLLGLSIFADKPAEQWCPVEKDSKPLFAWLDRIVKWTGHRPELQRIFTGGEHPFTYNNQTTMIKNYVMGLRVPHPFPPRKDGTISSSTDPPKESSAA